MITQPSSQILIENKEIKFYCIVIVGRSLFQECIDKSIQFGCGYSCIYGIRNIWYTISVGYKKICLYQVSRLIKPLSTYCSCFVFKCTCTCPSPFSASILVSWFNLFGQISILSFSAYASKHKLSFCSSPFYRLNLFIYFNFGNLKITFVNVFPVAHVKRA